MEFTPDKLEITLIDPVTENGPVEGRKYTLTHSDETGMLFLDIGNVYNYSAIDQDLRDEVLGRWLLPDNAPPMLIFYAYVGCEDFESAAKRYKIFKSHMEMAIAAIIYGDSVLFDNFPELVNAPIYVKFDSTVPNFNNYEYYGNVEYFIS